MHMCSMGVRHSRMTKSQVINNDLHPKWNEDFKLLVHEPDHHVPSLTLLMVTQSMPMIGKRTLGATAPGICPGMLCIQTAPIMQTCMLYIGCEAWLAHKTTAINGIFLRPQSSCKCRF